MPHFTKVQPDEGPNGMRWRVGPIVGMLILLAIAAGGFISSPPFAVTKIEAPTKQRYIPRHDQPTAFFAMGAWARDNREAIEPVTAVCGLVVAIAVAVVTGLLWGATRGLAESTEDLARGAHDQFVEMGLAREQETQRLELTEKQFLLAARECDLAEKQHGLQREQYIAEYPPKIKIRSIGIDRPQAGDLFQSDRIIKGSFVIANIGASDAKIREAVYRFFWGRGLPMVPPLQDDQVNQIFGPNLLPHTMAGHESCLITIESNELIGADAHTIIRGGGIYLYVMGAVCFYDWNLKERWMGFCQKYIDPETVGGEGRFIPVDNPNYEYQD
jgi:hypothetical protein